jgi:hypothetical protein
MLLEVKVDVDELTCATNHYITYPLELCIECTHGPSLSFTSNIEEQRFLPTNNLCHHFDMASDEHSNYTSHSEDLLLYAAASLL